MRALASAMAALAAACSPAAPDVDEPAAPSQAVAASATPSAQTPPTPPDEPPAADRTPTQTPSPADNPPPGVTVRADPPPPFTYWAPPGSVIRNHGNPGLWVAYLNGRQVKTYFGDGCGASRLQGWIGLLVDDLPALPPVLPQRNFARDEPVTQDLDPTRINVIYNPQTRRVEEVACY